MVKEVDRKFKKYCACRFSRSGLEENDHFLQWQKKQLLNKLSYRNDSEGMQNIRMFEKLQENYRKFSSCVFFTCNIYSVTFSDVRNFLQFPYFPLIFIILTIDLWHLINTTVSFHFCLNLSLRFTFFQSLSILVFAKFKFEFFM